MPLRKVVEARTWVFITSKGNHLAFLVSHFIITLVTDQISFANVCSSWQSAVSTLENFFVSSLQFPYLLLAENKQKPLRQVFVLSPNGEKGKIYKILLPEAANKRCVSSQGWLLTLSVFSEENDCDTVDAALLHPLTRRQIQLPKLDSLKGYRYHDSNTQLIIIKMVLSADPSLTDDFFIMVLFSVGRVAYCRPGYGSWIKLPTVGYGFVDDIDYHNGRMYLLHWWGEICSCDIGEDESMIIQGCPIMDSGIFERYLHLPAEISGILIEKAVNSLYMLAGFDDDKLVVVVREQSYYNHTEIRTTRFQVFENNLKDNKWVKIESLGDRALFLDYHTAISIQADGSIVKPSCIYFTKHFYQRFGGDVGKGGGTDMRLYHSPDMNVYHLSDGTIEPCFKGESLSILSMPLWVVPSL